MSGETKTAPDGDQEFSGAKLAQELEKNGAENGEKGTEDWLLAGDLTSEEWPAVIDKHFGPSDPEFAHDSMIIDGLENARSRQDIVNGLKMAAQDGYVEVADVEIPQADGVKVRRMLVATGEEGRAILDVARDANDRIVERSGKGAMLAESAVATEQPEPEQRVPQQRGGNAHNSRDKVLRAEAREIMRGNKVTFDMGDGMLAPYGDRLIKSTPKGDIEVRGAAGPLEDPDVVGREKARRAAGIDASRREAVKMTAPSRPAAEDPDVIMARMRDRMGLDEKGRPVTELAKRIHGTGEGVKAAEAAVAGETGPTAPEATADPVGAAALIEGATKVTNMVEVKKLLASSGDLVDENLHPRNEEGRRFIGELTGRVNDFIDTPDKKAFMEKYTAMEAAVSAEKAGKTAKSGVATVDSGKLATDTEYKQAFDIASATGVHNRPESSLTAAEVREQVKNAKDSGELLKALDLGIGSGHLNLDGGARTRETSGDLVERQALSRELAEKLSKLPRTLGKAWIEGQLVAGREAMAEAARDQIAALGNSEAAKDAAWDAALDNDREARHQAQVAEQFNAMRDQVKGDVMLQRQIEIARDAAVNTEKLRQQELTQLVGERVAGVVQRAYTREQGNSLVDRRTPNYGEIALMTREALKLERAPFAERRTQGVVESDFWSHQPNMNNVLVRERRDARTGELLSQNIMTLAGQLHVDKKGRVHLPDALEDVDAASLYYDVQERRQLGRSEHNLRGDMSRIYQQEYGASDTDIGLLRHEQQRQRGLLGRTTHRVRRRLRRFMG